MLTIRNLSKSYFRPGGSVQALEDVSLDVSAGELVVVHGPSGCGKTTLLLVAGGLLAPDAGRVEVDGRAPYQLGPDGRAAFRAATIGFVFQQFYLVPYLSVVDNARAGLLAAGRADSEDRARQLIERFGLADRADHLPGQLSTGERQRAALARAMVNRPKLILADEPTGNLDQANGQVVLNSLAAYAAAGGAVLLVTHDAGVSDRAHRTIHLESGRLAGP